MSSLGLELSYSSLIVESTRERERERRFDWSYQLALLPCAKVEALAGINHAVLQSSHRCSDLSYLDPLYFPFLSIYIFHCRPLTIRLMIPSRGTGLYENAQQMQNASAITKPRERKS